MFADTW